MSPHARAGALLALTFALGATPPCLADAVKVVELRSLPLSSRNGSHALTLRLYSFRGTRWHAEEIERAIPHVARILATCGVSVSGAEISVLEAPRRLHFYSTPLARELLRAIVVEKPAVFFVEDTLNRPAFDAEAIGLENSATRPELANTVWIAYGSRDLPFALAHELVHVLSDSGEHSDEPGNLMRAETAPQDTGLTPAQCERMRARGEANGLISRAR